MKITVADTAGFCFGVNRAVSELYKLVASEEKRRIFTVGPIIHNPFIIKDLESKNVFAVSDVNDIPQGSLAVIRTHGVTAETVRKLKERNIDYVDFTCPFVKKIQKIAAEKTEPDGVFLIAGDINHPEVQGIVSYANCPAYAFNSLEELEKLVEKEPGIVNKKAVMTVQTTFAVDHWIKISEFSKKLFIFLTIYDTICDATEKRQSEAKRLASESDVMIVIGGNGSSNTAKLYDAAKSICDRTYKIESVGEIPIDNIKKAEKIGVTAGASTPSGIIREVVEAMSTVGETFNDVSFEEALESSFRSVQNGDRVNAVVIAVAPNELQLDIGTKHAGYMSAAEYSADGISDLTKVVKPGDEMEVQVVRVNDVEGTVALSRKRVEFDTFRKELDAAADSRAILEGKVTEVINNAGVIVTYKGQTVFVPAAHSGVPKDGDLNSLKGQTVKFKILDIRFEHHHRKVVGSIKLAERDTRAENIEKVFADIEIGKEYVGKVKSITPFGAFVDVGGVDGLVHISELSWKKIKHPSEVVSVGEEIKVYVKDFTAEDHKISLGYRRPEDNMFLKFIDEHKIDDVVEVTVVKIMPYGAFAEIIPGVDGYIHISQIANKRIEKVSDYLKVGDKVNAKIIEINNEKYRVSLSIRALLSEEQTAEPANETIAEPTNETTAEEKAE